MNQQLHELLTILDRAKRDGGEEWVISAKNLHAIPHHVRQIALVKGCVEARGATSKREYRILPDGQKALADYNAKGTTRRVTVSPTAKARLMADRGLSEADFEPEEPVNGFVPTNKIAVVPNGSSAIVHPPAYPIEKNVDARAELDRIIAENYGSKTVVQTPDVLHTQACVRAIDILSEDFPEVNDLVNALIKIAQRKAATNE